MWWKHAAITEKEHLIVLLIFVKNKSRIILALYINYRPLSSFISVSAQKYLHIQISQAIIKLNKLLSHPRRSWGKDLWKFSFHGGSVMLSLFSQTHISHRHVSCAGVISLNFLWYHRPRALTNQKNALHDELTVLCLWLDRYETAAWLTAQTSRLKKKELWPWVSFCQCKPLWKRSWARPGSVLMKLRRVLLPFE